MNNMGPGMNLSLAGTSAMVTTPDGETYISADRGFGLEWVDVDEICPECGERYGSYHHYQYLKLPGGGQGCEISCLRPKTPMERLSEVGLEGSA